MWLALGMTPSLAGPLAKLNRARQHRDELGTAVRSWLDLTPYVIDAAVDDRTSWVTMRLRVVHAPPIQFGLIFGDMISNLRAALDHLVWQLVLVNKAQPRKGTCFPIVTHERDWDRASRALSGVADRWVKKMRAVQPYHDSTKAPDHPLAALDDVNNVNKHRVISPSATAALGYRPHLIFNRPTRGNEEIRYEQPARMELVSGARLGRVRIISPEKDIFIEKVGSIDATFVKVAFTIGDGRSASNSAVFGIVEHIFALAEPAFDE